MAQARLNAIVCRSRAGSGLSDSTPHSDVGVRQHAISSPVSSDGDAASSGSDLVPLSAEEIEALRTYSQSVQNFTYRLFENFRLEMESRASSQSASGKTHSTDDKPIVKSSADAALTNGRSSAPRKLSDFPRRRVRISPFPEYTGL